MHGNGLLPESRHGFRQSCPPDRFQSLPRFPGAQLLSSHQLAGQASILEKAELDCQNAAQPKFLLEPSELTESQLYKQHT